MKDLLHAFSLRDQHDLISSRHRSRLIAEALGFDTQDQARIVTAVSELVRDILQQAEQGKILFSLEQPADAARPPALWLELRGRGKSRPPSNGEGAEAVDGFASARRLMDSLTVTPLGEGQLIVRASKSLRRHARALSAAQIEAIKRELAADITGDPFIELRRQNEELAEALESLEQRHQEVQELNRELEETNRGVVALYAELDEKAESLRAASESKGRFLSNITHEFRTPLNSVLNLSQMLLSRLDGELSSEQERQVTLIHRGAGSLLHLVDELLDLAKLESGRTELHTTAFAVADVLKGLRGMMRPLLKEKVELLFDAPEELPPLVSDEGKLTQILRNLISNALKYTDAGRVQVAAEYRPEGVFRFRVEDTGVGIAEKDIPLIFEEFVQVEGDHQRGVRGTGLGLSLCKNLTALLGGTLRVTSELGKGSAFCLELPAQPEAAAAPSAETDSDDTPLAGPEAAAPARSASKSVLVVDDDEGTLYALERFFQDLGMRVDCARDGEEGLRLARELRPDLLVLDLIMPRLNGFGLARQLAAGAKDELPEIVLHTSKMLNSTDLAQARELNMLVFPKDGSPHPQRWLSLLQRSGLLDPPREVGG